LYMLGSSMCSAYSAHLNRDLVIIILAEFKLWGSAFCNLHRSKYSFKHLVVRSLCVFIPRPSLRPVRKT
jgi:hypothetical protein